jgi:hypothetical protein
MGAEQGLGRMTLRRRSLRRMILGRKPREPVCFGGTRLA